ncbi:MAG: hypothetical protein U0996_22090 [Planctomycetaceae bacterium]
MNKASSERRDQRILEHIARFRLSTVESIQAVLLRNLSLNAIRKIVRRLCADRLLQKFQLKHPREYLILGDRGARRLGLGQHRSAPLGPQALPLDYAILVYATLGHTPRLRLTTDEVRHRCPWLPEALIKTPHCMDASQTLELIRVDLGGPADHVARKCAIDISKRCRVPEFPALVASPLFRLVVITATDGKSAAIQKACARHDWPNGLTMHFATVSKLLSSGGSHHA